MFEKQVYVNRRLKLRKMIKSGLVLIPGNTESPMNYKSNTYRFRQDSNFLYFFGLDIPGLAGVIDIEDGKDCLYGNDFDIDDIIWMGPQPTLKELGEKVGILSTHPFKELQTTIARAIKQGRKIHILPPYRAESMILLEQLLGIHPSMINNYVSVELIKAVVNLRSVKEDVEIAEIEKACAAGYEMHVTAMKMAKPGVSEQDITGAIEGVAISKGYMPSFPIILSQNGETLHNHDHSQILTSGRLLLIDSGAEYSSHYASDFTRTIPVDGKFTERQKAIYNIVLAANNKAIEISKPGIPYLDVHKASAKVIVEGLSALGLMKGDADEAVANGAHALFFPHGLGHMMGLDVHDMEGLGEDYVGYDDEITRSDQFGTAYLRLGRRLQKGFVLTVEPGIYFIPALIEKWKSEKINESFINFDKVEEYIGFGGIRIEDDILITDNGCKIIGKRIPVTVEEIENIMKG
ncbi:aminopeptidase P family protein [Tenuifilum thalassicum]|uniref:Xaa-Pro aminopeptidase n=1 Tax=Tenuifilum thalassicum TaxID=2590900 RepID=A0A7D4CEX4_9BACT|nr:aminopeptidase P family protein [Tenuifilum thalassicum]QKG78726.1 aminopeptidase P family protein [Tenuifilum thalassicum]